MGEMPCILMDKSLKLKMGTVAIIGMVINDLTIIDIAKKANVSTATVSRVLNGTGNVSPKLRRRVEQVVAEENYIPNIFAKGMIRHSIQTIGVICPILLDPIHARYLSVIERNLRSHGFNVLLLCNMGRDSNKSPYLEQLLSKMVDAIILVGITMEEVAHPDSFVRAAAKVPILIVNGFLEAYNVYCVYADEYAAIRDVVCMLFQKGYRRPLYLYDTWTFSGYQKYNGYMDAFRSAGRDPDPDLLLRVEDFPEEAEMPEYYYCVSHSREIMEQALQRGLDFDCVVTADDILAAGAIEALRNAGRDLTRLPVIGFNNTFVADCTYPKLTSIDNLPDEMCSLAVSHLISVLKKKNKMQRLITPYRLAQRDSFVL